MKPVIPSSLRHIRYTGMLYRSVGTPLMTGRRSVSTVSRSSFDIFDTVLTRITMPEMGLWYEIGRRAVEEALVECDADQFGLWRKEAAERVRRRGAPPLLEDIVDQLAILLGVGPELSQRLAELELEVEEGMIRCVPAGRRLVYEAREKTGDSIIYISDMHLPSFFLRERLKQFGLWEEGDCIWVSCESAARKSDGTLFPLVLKYESLHPSELLHTGDADLGDRVAARWQGLRVSPLIEARPNRFERLLSNDSHMVDAPEPWLAGAARQARLMLPAGAPEGHGKLQSPALQRIAVDVAGPLLVSYCLWLLQQAEALGKDRLYFLSRDGQVLQQISASLAEQLNIQVECRYLHGGRLAWQLPALAAGGESAGLNALIAKTTSYTEITLVGVAIRLGLSAEYLAERSGLERVDEAQPLSIEDRRRVEAWLASHDGHAAVLAAARTELPLVMTYLRQQGLLGDEAWALVDVGWSGGTVRALNQLLGAAGRGPATTLFIGYLGPGGAQRLPYCRSYLWDTDSEVARERSPGATGLIEAMCSGTHGPVAGYRSTSSGAVEPYLLADRGVADASWSLREFRTFLFEFVDLLLPQLRPEHVRVVDADAVAAVLDELCRHPGADEARALGSCPREEDAQGTSVFPVARPFVLTDLPNVIRPGPMFGRNLGWVPGALALTPVPLRHVFRLAIGLTTLLRAGEKVPRYLRQLIG